MVPVTPGAVVSSLAVMPVERLLPTDEAADLLDLTRELADREVLPRASGDEATATPPRDVFRVLGRAGLLSLPSPEEFGGADQPYEVYLQVVEEIAQRWMAVAVGVSVHCLTAYPVAEFGTREQQEALLPGMLGGEQLGAYGLSEREFGSDIAHMRTRAVQEGEDWRIKGT